MVAGHLGLLAGLVLLHGLLPAGLLLGGEGLVHGQGEPAQLAEGRARIFREERFAAIHMEWWGMCK